MSTELAKVDWVDQCIDGRQYSRSRANINNTQTHIHRGFMIDKKTMIKHINERDVKVGNT